MKELKPPYNWLVYLVALVLGTITSFSFVTLRVADKTERNVIVNPAKPIVIRDTITKEVVKWHRPIRRICCQHNAIGNNEKEEKILERAYQADTSTYSSKTTSAQGQMEDK